VQKAAFHPLPGIEAINLTSRKLPRRCALFVAAAGSAPQE
jgi:hypothetical protein